MTRFIAFIRAINVGGHTVNMEYLRHIFESLGFSSVETFIASGNVIFDLKVGDVKELEKQIKKQLHDTLGFEVAAFIRTDLELADIAKYKPFQQSAMDTAGAFS